MVNRWTNLLPDKEPLGQPSDVTDKLKSRLETKMHEDRNFTN